MSGQDCGEKMYQVLRQERGTGIANPHRGRYERSGQCKCSHGHRSPRHDLPSAAMRAATLFPLPLPEASQMLRTRVAAAAESCLHLFTLHFM